MFTTGNFPPGCWPIDPSITDVNPDVDTSGLPIGCITLPEDALDECSEAFPCFCELPTYQIVTDGMCVAHGLVDVLDADLSRALMDDGYYGTRDQNDNGVIDSFEDYPIPFVSGLPPGCWPIEVGTPGFEGTEFPFASITPLDEAVDDCSDNFPCFCLAGNSTAEPVPEPTPMPVNITYAKVVHGTCTSHGMIDILDEATCRAVMNDGYYNTRDQNNNGILDAFEDYTFLLTEGSFPPGCWPIDPSITRRSPMSTRISTRRASRLRDRAFPTA